MAEVYAIHRVKTESHNSNNTNKDWGGTKVTQDFRLHVSFWGYIH